MAVLERTLEPGTSPTLAAEEPPGQIEFMKAPHLTDRARWFGRALAQIGIAPAVLLAGWGCAGRTIIIEGAPQAHYQTASPLHDTSRELERIFQSLKRVTLRADYTTYVFPADGGMTEAAVSDPAALSTAIDTLAETHSKAGTAVVLARSSRGALLLTNDHVAHYPPFQLSYLDEGIRISALPPERRRVATVSIRTQERGFLTDHPSLGAFRVLARDSANDLALLEVTLPPERGDLPFPPVPVAPGDPRRLSWGSFVYVLGFPRGYAMVTRGMVSDPNRDRTGGFLTDGLWNEGISGGPILAVRGESGALEWVGVARAGAGAQEVRLQPAAEQIDDELGLSLLYEGPIYAETFLRLQYGITLSVPMVMVRDFLDRNRGALRARGYDLAGY